MSIRRLAEKQPESFAFTEANRRWAEERAGSTTEPSEFLVSEVQGLTPGAALDLACGAGRNAVWLARHGWRVTGVDREGIDLRRDGIVARLEFPTPADSADAAAQAVDNLLGSPKPKKRR